MSEVRVVVGGLRDLSKALNAAEDGAQKEVAGAMKEIAESVAADVRARVPHRSGRLAASYRARGSVKGAAIAYGGPKVPYAGFIDYGGRVGRNRSVKRTFIKGGRYLYPAITDGMEEVAAKVAAAIDDITSRYGFKVEGSN